jgi:hypothetical protein
MPLRARLQPEETLQDFELAWPQRYFEGLELMIQGDTAAGIYLMGYAAEMLLKRAYFLLTGAAPTDLVGPRLGPARARAAALGVAVGHESYHSLLFWGLLLIEERRALGQPLPVDLEVGLLACTGRLYQNSWVELRYRPDSADPAEAEEVREAVDWLREAADRLWS